MTERDKYGFNEQRSVENRIADKIDEAISHLKGIQVEIKKITDSVAEAKKHNRNLNRI